MRGILYSSTVFGKVSRTRQLFPLTPSTVTIAPQIQFDIDRESSALATRFESILARNLASQLNAVISAADQIVKGPLVARDAQSGDGRPHLPDSIVKTYATPDHLEVSVVTNSAAAGFYEEDAGPRVIVPVNARALRFESQGQVVFAARVVQPARQGTHAWKQAAEFVGETLPGLVLKALETSLKGLNQQAPSAAELAGARVNRISAPPLHPATGPNIRNRR